MADQDPGSDPTFAADSPTREVLMPAARPSDPVTEQRELAELRRRLFGTAALPEGGPRVGRYELRRKLGAGGVGTVYLAHDPELDREVAVKLVDRRSSRSSDVDRLTEEARVLARLSHPHVVAVHDVGAFTLNEREGVYIVMDLVDGDTLAEWLKARERSVSEIVDVFCEAAEGLAAAHAAGVAHRDIKPGNLMVDRAGKVIVVDFGLARPFSAESVETDSRGRRVVLGTPAYMAPEQFEGARADARSDQFALCITFAEAVVGRRPFRGKTPEQICKSLQGPPDFGGPRRGPPWLMKALARGLSYDPQHRFPSMQALLDAVRRGADRPRRQRMVAGVVVLGLAGVGVGAWGLRAVQTAGCLRTDEIATVWDETTRERVRERFVASGAAFATDSFERVDAELTEYVGALSAERAQACAGSPDESAVVLACLDTLAGQARVAADVLGTADLTLVRQSTRTVADLLPPEICSSANAGWVVETTDPGDPRTRQKLHELELALFEAATLRRGDRAKEALELAEGALDQAREAGLGRAESRAQLQIGRIHLDSREGGLADAEAAFRAALLAAERAGADDAAVESLMELAWLFGSTRMESEEGLRYLEQAEARATSLALAPRVRFQLPYTRGAVLRRAHQPEESAAAFEQALSIATEREHPDDHEIARARMSLATAYIALGRLDEARAAYQEAIETWERVDGPDHPNLANPLLGLARIEMGGDHPERAVPYAERGAALSLDSRDGGSANLALADAYRVAGRPEEALGALDVSHALTAKTLGDDHPMLLAIHRARAGSYWSMGRFDEAEDAAERAIEFARQSQGERSAAHATALALRGFLRTERDPDDVARADLEHALALLADVEPDAVRGYLARAELGLARIEAASGNLDAVRTHVERVRELGGNSNRYRSLVALADFELARVLATGTAGRDPACTLAKAALESISTRPSAANKAEQMRAWVEERCRVIGIPG